MNYEKISKETVSYIYAAYSSFEKGPLDLGLRALIELVVSKINKCENCIKLHTKQALEAGVKEEKIKNISNFKTNNLFSEAEKEALSWARTLTNLDDKKRAEDTNLSKYYSERDVVDITTSICLMNALNRMSISMRDE